MKEFVSVTLQPCREATQATTKGTTAVRTAMSIYLCTNTYIVGLLSHYPIEPVFTVLYSPYATATY